MTDDLVKRLRCYADLNDAVYHPWVYGEAADRIERLEVALNQVVDLTDCWENSLISQVNEIARDALEGKDD